MSSKQEIAKKILAYALDCYNYGWDVVYECYAEADIIREMEEEKLSSYTATLAHFRFIVSVKKDQRREIMAEVF